MLGEMHTDMVTAVQRETRLDERRRIHNRLRLQAQRVRTYYGAEQVAEIWDRAADLALDGDGQKETG